MVVDLAHRGLDRGRDSHPGLMAALDNRHAGGGVPFSGHRDVLTCTNFN